MFLRAGMLTGKERGAIRGEAGAMGVGRVRAARRRAGLLLLASIAVTVVVAVISETGHSEPPVAAGLAQSFAVLRAPAVGEGADRLGTLGANPALAHRAVTADGTVLYLAPGDGTLCLAVVGAGICGSAEKAKSSGLVVSSKLGTDPRGTVRVQGVVPDGVTTVTIAGDGVSRQITVQDNAFAYRGPNVATISWAGRAGTVTQVAGLPETTV
jgi:hypothetical protein